MWPCLSCGDKTVYRKEVTTLEKNSHLCLNVSKTKEVVVDYKGGWAAIFQSRFNGASVERVDTFKYLGVNIHKGSDLCYPHHLSSQEGPTRIGLRCLRTFGLRPQILMDFYRGTMTGCFTTW